MSIFFRLLRPKKYVTEDGRRKQQKDKEKRGESVSSFLFSFSSNFDKGADLVR